MEHVEPAYQVKLEAFTGPLDLLLHLIRKNEINIYDIPVALIAQQFLEYLTLIKHMNLSFAGEFLVMAATLLQIKSRMLLPKEEKFGEGEEEEIEDPRSELVRRLVEYQQYKEAAGRLSEQERVWQEMFHREPVQELKEPVRDVLWDDVSLFDLLDALQEVLTRTESESFVNITPDSLTVQDRINAIVERLEQDSTVTFATLFEDVATKLWVIVTFLALLELVRMRMVRIYQGDLFGPIRITRTFLAGQGEEGLDRQNGHGGKGSTNNGGVDA